MRWFKSKAVCSEKVNRSFQSRKRTVGRFIWAAYLALLFLVLSGTHTESWAGEWKEEKWGWRYYQDHGSYVKTGWLEYEGDWYYFNDFGYMTTGWVFYHKNHYYLNEDGRMAIGWKEINGNYYYFWEDGAMAFDTITPDGYALGPDGIRAETKWLSRELKSTELFGSWLFAPIRVMKEENQYRVYGVLCDNGYDTEEKISALTIGDRVFLPWTGEHGEVISSIEVVDRTMVTVQDIYGSQFYLSHAGMSVIWGDTSRYKQTRVRTFSQGQRSSLYLVRLPQTEFVVDFYANVGFGGGADCPQTLGELLRRCESRNQQRSVGGNSNPTNRYDFISIEINGIRIEALADWEANYDSGIVE